MTQSPDHESRISRLEIRLEEVAADAASARHLAAARDRDLADLTVKVDANRRAINALGQQTRGRFDQVDARFDRLEAEMRAGFAELRTGVAELRTGVTDLRTGVTDLRTGVTDLRTGVTDLRTGHDTLAAAVRHGFDQSAAGFTRIAELIAARGDER